MEFASQKNKYLRILRKLIKKYDKPTPLLIVTGMSGSGTTLVGGYIYQNYEVKGICPEVPNIVSSKNLIYFPKVATYTNLSEYLKSVENYQKKEDFFDVLQETSKEFLEFNSSGKYLLYKNAVLPMYSSVQFINNLPNSNMIVVFRNPLSSIEGLIRKWSLFKRSNLKDLCNFWANSYENVLKDSKKNKINYFFVEYENFLTDHCKISEIIANKIIIKKREKKKISDSTQKRGKGIRGVFNGLINLDQSKTNHSNLFNSSDKSKIERITKATFLKLKKRSLC